MIPDYSTFIELGGITATSAYILIDASAAHENLSANKEIVNRLKNGEEVSDESLNGEYDIRIGPLSLLSHVYSMRRIKKFLGEPNATL